MVALTPDGYPAHEQSRAGDAPLFSQSAAGVFAGFGLIAALGLGWTLARTSAGLPPFQARGPVGQISAPGAKAETQALNVISTDLQFNAKEFKVAGPGALTVKLDNQGVIEHDFSIEGLKGKAYAGPKKAGEGTFQVAKPGTYTFFCSIPGHKEAGMVGKLVVGDGATGATGTAASTTAAASHGAHGAAAPSHAAVATTETKGNVPLEPRIENGVKVFDITSSIVKWEVLPGVFEEAMAYNGMVPGPLLRVQEGDKVRVNYTNKLPEPSVVHFHGPRIPNAMDGVPDVTQPVVKPGETFPYEFTANPAGTYMYHSHHNSVVQEPAGQHGLIIIDPKPGSAEAIRDAKFDRDVVQVLNEFNGYFTINGKAFPATEPIEVKQGERVRIRLVNLGQALHPMHLHGYHFTVIGTDGRPVQGPPLEKDTVTLGPGERVDLEFLADHPGTWVFHCHILSHVANKGVEPGGMLTLIKVI
jgi:manganese oxidase